MKDDDNFSSISEILGSSITGDAKNFIASKYAVFFSFWNDIVGSRFSLSSKPYSVKNKKLYVMCENSYVVQELMMYKRNLLSKIKPYAKGVELEIVDIVFSYKNWEKISEETTVDDDFSNIDPMALETDEATKQNIANIVDRISFLDPKMKNKLYLDILNNIKVSGYRRRLY